MRYKQGSGKMIQRLWSEDESKTGDILPRAFLRLLSLPYGAAVLLRNTLYDRRVVRQKRLPCPVVSVGNLTVGGTGKTPTVIMIARLLQQRGFHPAVLSRGYGGNSKKPVNVVSDGRRSLLNWEECGDEPVLMAAMLPGVPVLTGPERYRTGLAAVERFGADIVILDDAFQHRQLFRDIDIVLLDAKRHLGNGFLLPRGPLRESARSLRRAHILLVTGVSEEGGLPEETRGLPLFRGIHRPSGIVSGSTGEIETVEILRGEKIVAFSGIGNSETFRKGLTALGASVVSFLDFPDHHPYTSSDIDKLRSIAVACGVSRLVTTEKDAVRLTSFPEFQQETSMLRITMEISPCSEFQELLLSHLPVK